MATAILAPNGRLTLPRTIDDYLDLCHEIYEGLSEDDIDEVEAIARGGENDDRSKLG